MLSIFRYSGIAVAVYLGGISVAAAGTIEVPRDARTIQEAVTLADDGDQIVVAPGTYQGPIDLLGKAVHLRSHDGPNNTIITVSQPGVSVISCVSGEGPTTTIEGFTISGGDANLGGAINIASSSPTILNCVFTGNSATQGGAINITHGAPMISNCVFEANTAAQGAAIRNFSANTVIAGCLFYNNLATVNGGAIANTSSNPEITNCQFLHNSSTDEGGAVYNAGGSTATIRDSLFEANIAGIGGAVFGNDINVSDIGESVFCYNLPENIAGPFTDQGDNEFPQYCAEFVVPTEFDTIQDAINTVTSAAIIHVKPGVYSEAIDLLGKSILLRSTEGAELTTIDASGLSSSVVTFANGEGLDTVLEGFTIIGGDGQNGGGVMIHNSSPVVRECVLTENQAEQGGAVAISGDAQPQIIDCDVQGNSASLAGGGIWSESPALPMLQDSFFCQNTPDAVDGPFDDLGGNEFATYCQIIEVPAEFATIQEAIDAVVLAGHIIVLPGTYLEAIDFHDKVVLLESAGDENDTTIDASGLQASTVTINGGQDSSTILRGFTITGGSATFGGGLLIADSAPSIEHCRFVNNEASNSGGAIHLDGGSSVIQHVQFTGNAAQTGGAISSDNGGLSILESTFSSNTAEDGGAVHVLSGSASITFCDFENNTASSGDGGAIKIEEGVPVDLGHTRFCFNDPEDIDGSFADLGGNTFETYCKTIFVPADFGSIQAAINSVTTTAIIEVAAGTYNEAIDFLGKVIYLRSQESNGSGEAVIDATGHNASAVSFTSGEGPDSIIEGFTVTGGTGTERSNSVSIGGGILIMQSSPTVQECLIVNNSAMVGGGVYVEDSSAVIDQCTISENEAIVPASPFGLGTLSGLGGGVALFVAEPTISNSDIVENLAEDGGGLYSDIHSEVLLENTTICDNLLNNISGRFTDGDGNTLCTAIGDLNGDGVVDVSDLLILLAAWGVCPDPDDCPADLNGDGTVDVSDLLILLANWG